MSGFLVPRTLAALSTAAAGAAVAWPATGHGWRVTVGFAAAALLLAIEAHLTAAAVRTRMQLARRLRTARPARNVRVLEPPRVSDDPTVSLLARIHATPEPHEEAIA